MIPQWSPLLGIKLSMLCLPILHHYWLCLCNLVMKIHVSAVFACVELDSTYLQGMNDSVVIYCTEMAMVGWGD